jgi:hypothetical protein
MHYSHLSVIALANLLAATAGHAADDASSDAIYAKAKTALAKNDCASAVPLLSAYKVLERGYLGAHPAFAAQIDSQIRLCTLISSPDNKSIKGLQPGTVIMNGHVPGSKIDGHTLGSKDMAIGKGSVE